MEIDDAGVDASAPADLASFSDGGDDSVYVAGSQSVYRLDFPKR